MILGSYRSQLKIGRRHLGLGLRRNYHQTWDLERLCYRFWRELDRHRGWRVLEEVTLFKGVRGRIEDRGRHVCRAELGSLNIIQSYFIDMHSFWPKLMSSYPKLVSPPKTFLHYKKSSLKNCIYIMCKLSVLSGKLKSFINHYLRYNTGQNYFVA